MEKILNQEFFNRSAVEVAKDLLGKFLVRQYQGKKIAAMITEVEAYDGLKDKASHASKGKTMRNKVMFREAGYWYIYLTYGMHWMLNAVTGSENYPAAVLIRGVEVINGPARLTRHFKVDRKFNDSKISLKSDLWIEDRGIKINSKKIKSTKRIGVEYAGKYWANRKYRFYI